MSEPTGTGRDDAARATNTERDSGTAAEAGPSDSGHSDDDSQAQRNTDDESPS